jgi:hypothetical protein
MRLCLSHEDGTKHGKDSDQDDDDDHYRHPLGGIDRQVAHSTVLYCTTVWRATFTLSHLAQSDY